MRNAENKRAYDVAYRQRPEVKKRNADKMRARYHQPGVKESLKILRQRPDIKERERTRRQQPKAKAKAKAYHLYRNYGLTWESYESMITGQGSVCAVCGSSDWGHMGPLVDHNHETGVVRGVVCHKCNIGIGLIGDSLQRARSVVDYLERSRQGGR